MGCGSSKTLDDEDDHEIKNGIAYDKDEQVDFSQNSNTYITKNENYYKNQKPNPGSFKDDKFPPTYQSFIGKDEDNERKEKSGRIIRQNNLSEGDIVWKHAKEIWPEGKIFNEKMTIKDIKIGEVSDAYFVATLAAMSEFPRLILQLFKTVELPNDGSAIEVGLKIDGFWKIIPIDDMFPVRKSTNKPIFSDTETQALWGVILEKAWAKVNGGYANIIFGYPREVFETFTPFTTIPIDIEKENKNSFWKNIREADAYKCIMTASIDEDNNNDIESVGLVANHTFSLVSAFESEVNGEIVKLIKLRNPFGKGEWTGDWSDQSDKWDDNTKAKFNYNDQEINDGIFWIDFENFCKYFNKVSICVPLNPLYSTSLKINKADADEFNVIKIQVPKTDSGQIICSISICSKSYRFHRKIKSGQNVIENLILAKIENDEFRYVDSAYNESISTNLTPGEYLCVYNVSYKICEVPPRKYTLNITCSDPIQLCEMQADSDFSLLKAIMIPKIEKLNKYKSRFENKIVLFTGNRFENSALSFFYIQNKGKDILYFEPKIYFKNIISLEGDIPPLKKKKKDKYLYLGCRRYADQPFQSGGNGKTYEEEIPNSYEPEIKESILESYKTQESYRNMDLNFQFIQQ